MLRLSLLLSGKLGFQLLKNLIKNNNVQIVSVFTDFRSNEIVNFCSEEHINLFKGNPRKKKSELTDFISNNGDIDLLFSINYLFIIEKELINYPKLFALNIHGSLLPKYRGRTPHVWSIINGEEKTGITIHKIDEGVDTGDILLQKEVPININDTGAMILEKYNVIYPLLVEKAIDIVLEDKQVYYKQDNSKATYFGKRTPEDGEINWDWNKERIRNWVRAQAAPYPGAFTYVKGNKLIIDKVIFSEMGYNSNMTNGIVLSDDPLVVKVGNGAIEIVNYNIEEQSFKIIKENILGK